MVSVSMKRARTFSPAPFLGVVFISVSLSGAAAAAGWRNLPPAHHLRTDRSKSKREEDATRRCDLTNEQEGLAV